jgi:hypothetical protein
MDVGKHDWESAVHGPLTEDTIRKRHQPSEAYRISRFVYPRGTSFRGTMRPGVCYVLQGTCRYDGHEIVSGQQAELSGGDYSFETVGEETVEIILVWPLPQHVRPR